MIFNIKAKFGEIDREIEALKRNKDSFPVNDISIINRLIEKLEKKREFYERMSEEVK